MGRLTGHYCDGVLVGSETALDAKRFPGVSLLILRNTICVLGRSSLSRHITHTRARATNIQLHQPQRPPDGGVRLPTRPEGSRTTVHPQFLADRSVDNYQRSTRMGGSLYRIEVECFVAYRLHRGNNHRKILRPTASHHRVHCQLLHGRRAPIRWDFTDNVLRLHGRSGQHISHSLQRWGNDR